MATLASDQIGVTEFGEFLRRARERRGVTLQQISNETKIPFRILDALERGNLSAVPDGMYRRAEIRAYADVVGLDRSVALAQLEHALTAAAPPDPQPADTGRDRSRAVPAAKAVAAIAVLGSLTLVTAPRLIQDPSTRAREAHPPAASRPAEMPVSRVSEQTESARPAPQLPKRVPQTPAAETAHDAITRTAAVVPPPPALPAVLSLADEPRPSNLEPELVIVTDPPGARVMVNGIGWGNTPLALRHLTAGDKRIRLVKDGFISDERVVRVGRRGTTTVNVVMNAAAGARAEGIQ